jgi:hypothetical protein
MEQKDIAEMEGGGGWNISITLSLLWYTTDEECRLLDGRAGLSPASTWIQLTRST